MYKLECKIINGLKNQSLSDITKITKEFIKNKQGSELFYKSIIERSIHLIPNEDALSISDYIKSFDNYASNKIYLRDMMIKSQPVLESHLDKLSFQDICSILFIFRSHHIGNTNFYRKINTKLMNSMPNEISQIDISKIANWLADPLRTQLYTETVYKQMADKITLSSELIKIFQGFVVADKADYEILNIVSKILVENVSYFKCDEISHALHLFSRSK